MKPSSFSLFATSIALTPLALTAASTVPIGYLTVTVPAGADAIVSVPVARQTAFSGAIDSAIVDNPADTGTISVAGAFTADEFLYDGVDQFDQFFVRVASTTIGTNGMWYRIDSNTADALTVDLAGQALTPGAAFLSAGATVRVAPFWTLEQLFDTAVATAVLEPASQLNPSDPTDGDRIMFMAPAEAIGAGLVDGENSGSNVNAGVFKAVYVFDNDDDSSDYEFYEVGESGPTPLNIGALAIAPDNYFIIRNNGVDDKDFMFSGVVPDTDMATVIERDSDNIDNHVANPFPVDVSLYDLGLHQTSAFLQCSDWLPDNGDMLLAYDDAQAGDLDTPPTRAYVYYDGSDGLHAAGWYNFNNPFAGVIDSEDSSHFLKAGAGFIIRSKGDVAGDSDVAGSPLPYALD